MWRLVDRIAYEENVRVVRNPIGWPIGPVRQWLDQRFLVRVPAWAVQDLRVHLPPHAMGSPGLHVLSMTSAAWLAQTSLGDETRVIPLCAVALSAHPALLQRMQAQFGLEVQLLPIGIYSWFLSLARSGQGLVLQAAFWSWPWSLRWPTLPSACCCQPWESPTSSESANSAPTDIGRSMRQSAHRRSRLRAPVRRLRSLSA